MPHSSLSLDDEVRHGRFGTAFGRRQTRSKMRCLGRFVIPACGEDNEAERTMTKLEGQRSFGLITVVARLPLQDRRFRALVSY
jgi:hypothetical protein